MFPNNRDPRKRKEAVAGVSLGMAVQAPRRPQARYPQPPNLPFYNNFAAVPYPHFDQYPPFAGGSSSSNNVAHQTLVNDITAPFKSFTDLLTAVIQEDEGQHHDALSTAIEKQRQELDQIITYHCNNLRQTLGETLRKAAEEKAASKLKKRDSEQNARSSHETAELERRVEHHKAEAERLRTRVQSLERAERSLRSGLRIAIAGVRREEDAESSSTRAVSTVRLECKVCERRMANVMMWPCRHVCVCTACEAEVCPVCYTRKTTSFEVLLP